MEIDKAVNTVTFNPNGGWVSTTSKQIVFGEPYGELPTPTYVNYNFDGWYTSASGGEKITAASIVNVKNNQTLYAHWTQLAPTITTQPKSVSVVNGKSATLRVAASGGNLKYQWQYKKAGASSWTTWSGRSSASLTVVGSDTNNDCQYRCVVSNSAGSITSNAATLTVGTTLKSRGLEEN